MTDLETQLKEALIRAYDLGTKADRDWIDDSASAADDVLSYHPALLRCCQSHEATIEALKGIWNEWSDSDNAKDPEASGYETLQKVKDALALDKGANP